MKLFLGIISLFTINCYSQTDSISPKQNADSIVYDINKIQEKPQFPGGDKALSEFIAQNVHYPKQERDNRIQGKVFVTFVIDENGNVTHIELFKGIDNGPGCNKEALRVIKLLPKWIPGKQNGKPVKCRYFYPFSFKVVN